MLILLDVEIPVLDGPGFAAAYQREPGPKAPVVVVTGCVPPARHAAEMGEVGYLTKPFGVAALLAVVARRALTRRAA